MKIAVVTVQVPFVRGGAEELGGALVKNLRARDHDAELIAIPFRWHPPEQMLDHMLAARLLRVPAADRVIALKFPAYCMPHDDKVVWLLHQHRQIYDLRNERTAGQQVPTLTEVVQRADTLHLGEARERYAISDVVRDRLRESTGLDAHVLYPPLVKPELYQPGPYGDYVLAPGRIEPIKRQLLAVEAMRHVRSPIRLVVAGPVSDPRHLRRLQTFIARHRLGDRVTLIGEWVSEERKAQLVSGARAVVIPSLGEDYGLVCIEAFAAEKAVITCTDSGGPALLSVDGRTGTVVAPTPVAIAAAIDAVGDDVGAATQLGRGARERLDELGLSWDHVVEELCR